tara:strand:+ start:178 stop:735 length:558 start_codon:yes stop_codon:yes gene_type:complete
VKRFVSVLVLSVALVPGAALAQGVSEEPIGNLAELMRGIMFVNANKLFDAQAVEPGTVPVPEMDSDTRDAVSALIGSASSRFAAIYRGWPEVAGAAASLADGAKLALIEGRVCDNGETVPVADAAYIEGARLLEESATNALNAAREENWDGVWEAVNYVNESCTHCHKTYRDGPDSRQEPRCQSQ